MYGISGLLPVSELLIAELPYQSDSSLLFDSIADEQWAVFLDSSQPAAIQGRYDIIAARPNTRITTQNGVSQVETWSDSYADTTDPFAILKEHIGKQKKFEVKLPFISGALGYFSYDLGRYIEKIPTNAKNDIDLPEMKIGIYSWSLIVDHKKRKTYLLGDKNDSQIRKNWGDLESFFKSKALHKNRERFRATSEVKSNFDYQAYAKAFEKIKKYIHDGDCYQVNLAQRFHAEVEGHPWLAYKLLRSINPSPFGAYLNYPEFQVLSNSPERFLSIKDKIVQTKPIKGTRPRSKNNLKDKALKDELIASEKDRAENLMIVDLLRNDISKNCALGSVQVPKLFDIESFPNVHHMVSTVTGRLREKRSAIDLLRGCFPGGSITGAPKLRAMEIIEELEPNRRGIYCGAIGYIGMDGNMDTNIAIRTIVHKNKKMYFNAGGGIVFDSELKAEYQETFDKAAAMMKLFVETNNYAMGN